MREQFFNGIGPGYKVNTGLDEKEIFIRKNIDAKASINNFSKSGCVSINYRRIVYKKLNVGLALLAEKKQADIFANNNQVGFYFRKAITVAAESKVVYGNRGIVNVYGLFGLGATFIHQKIQGDNGALSKTADTYFNFQISPVGVSIGKSLRGFAETGFGYKGIVHLGAAYKF